MVFSSHATGFDRRASGHRAHWRDAHGLQRGGPGDEGRVLPVTMAILSAFMVAPAPGVRSASRARGPRSPSGGWGEAAAARGEKGALELLSARHVKAKIALTLSKHAAREGQRYRMV